MKKEELIQKKCNKCNNLKSVSEFYINKRTKDGYNIKCKSCVKYIINEYNKKPETKEKIKSRKKKYNDSEHGKLINQNYRKKYYTKNKNIENVRSTKWNIENKDKIKIYKKEYEKKYYKKNKFKIICRRMISRTIKTLNTKKSGHTNDILKYSPDELKYRIESLFKIGMSWDNYGEWHIDHIISISKFPINTPFYIVNALSNLQPLWKEENLKKGNK